MQPTDYWIESPHGLFFARSWGLAEPATRARALAEPATRARAIIVLFHDSLGCVDLWRDFPEQLSRATGCSVIAYDRLGFGRSDPHPGILAADFIHTEATTNIPALCEQLHLGELIPFGYSVGGAMAVATAALLPERCSAIVTMSAQAFVEDRTIVGIREAQARCREPGQIERLARYHGEKARWVLDAWIETWLSPAFKAWSLDADLARIRCPLLALHGDRDEYGSLRHPERISARTSGPSEVVVIENCGHLPQREHPELVLSALTDFLGA